MTDSLTNGPAIPAASIFVTIGTDHHRFPRLIGWIDDYLEAHPELRDRTLVQHGQSAPSRLARNEAFISYADLMDHMRDATVVVVHGGPASIFESRNQGRLPICVPRVPALAEIVDEHQERFARHLAADDLLVLCEDRESLFAAMDSLLADPDSGVVHEDGTRLQGTFENLERVISSLEHRPRPRPRELARPLTRSLARLVATVRRGR